MSVVETTEEYYRRAAALYASGASAAPIVLSNHYAETPQESEVSTCQRTLYPNGVSASAQKFSVINSNQSSICQKSYSSYATLSNNASFILGTPLPFQYNESKENVVIPPSVHLSLTEGHDKPNCQINISLQHSISELNRLSFDEWCVQLKTVEDMIPADIRLLRFYYKEFLNCYPLCYQIWKRWAETEINISHDVNAAYKIILKGLDIIPTSIHLWMFKIDLLNNYFNFLDISNEPCTNYPTIKILPEHELSEDDLTSITYTSLFDVTNSTITASYNRMNSKHEIDCQGCPSSCDHIIETSSTNKSSSMDKDIKTTNNEQKYKFIKSVFEDAILQIGNIWTSGPFWKGYIFWEMDNGNYGQVGDLYYRVLASLHIIESLPDLMNCFTDLLAYFKLDFSRLVHSDEMSDYNIMLEEWENSEKMYSDLSHTRCRQETENYEKNLILLRQDYQERKKRLECVYERNQKLSTLNDSLTQLNIELQQKESQCQLEWEKQEKSRLTQEEQNKDERFRRFQKTMLLKKRKEGYNISLKCIEKRQKYEELIQCHDVYKIQLNNYELSAWRDYIQYEKDISEKTNHEQLDLLFRRCLVSCNYYIEFWDMYVYWLIEGPLHDFKKARFILSRGRDIYLKDNISIYLLSAEIEECLLVNEQIIDHSLLKTYMLTIRHYFEKAIQLSADSGAYFEILLKYISFEKRHGCIQQCKSIFSTALEKFHHQNDTIIMSQLSIMYAYFLLDIFQDIISARTILNNVRVKHVTPLPLLLASIDIEYRWKGMMTISTSSFSQQSLSIINANSSRSPKTQTYSPNPYIDGLDHKETNVSSPPSQSTESSESCLKQYDHTMYHHHSNDDTMTRHTKQEQFIALVSELFEEALTHPNNSVIKMSDGTITEIWHRYVHFLINEGASIKTLRNVQKRARHYLSPKK